MNASANTSDPDLSAGTPQSPEILRSEDKLQFHTPQPEDIIWAKPILMQAQRMGCEFCFGNIYAWAERYGTGIAHCKGFFIARNKSKLYSLPQGPGDLNEVLPLLREDAHRHGVPLTFFGVNSGDIPRLEAACPGAFRYETNPDFYDYIYRREDLAALAGKKYHQKRNHVARFMRANDWLCEAITPDTLEECMDMERQWIERNGEKDPEGLRDERRALERIFAHYEAFGLRGALLRSGGRIVAFTLGEELNEHCFCTHFEKAFTEETGAYQTINRCFAATFLEGYEFINREEDLGDEGLRRAKQSYYPVILLEKYLAVEKEA